MNNSISVGIWQTSRILLKAAVICCSQFLFATFACAQMPNPLSLPGAAPQSKAQTPTEKPGVLKREGQEVATTTGPISVSTPVHNKAVHELLVKLLPKYPGVRAVNVDVENGVVTLSGHVQDEDVRDDVTDFVRRVEGVRIVLNQMQTDDQVMTGWEHAKQSIAGFWYVIRRKWLLGIMALGLVAAGFFIARKVNDASERLMAPIFENVLLRSVAGSIFAAVIVICSALTALSLLDLTHVVLSILGLAGLVTLAVGFAFKDIVENFIASVLLGVRRPFQIGDFIQLAGHSGIVKSLNTRATILISLDGSQIRIPNSIVFKETVVNSNASSSARSTFDLVVPYDVSTSSALMAVDAALEGHDGVLDDPAPRTLVESLDPDGVRLRAYFWTPVNGVDGLKVQSDAKLRAKVELQKAGIFPTAQSVWNLLPSVVRTSLEHIPTNGREQEHRGSANAAQDQARANLKLDMKAAKEATDQLDPNVDTPEKIALNETLQNGRRDEGANLLEPSSQDQVADSPSSGETH